jgi:ABC-type proline/glycine betaine transport system permease subunit
VHKSRQSLRTAVVIRTICTLLASWIGAAGLSGCVAVGYSSGRGWFVWPGGLGLLIIVLIIVFVSRRR